MRELFSTLMSSFDCLDSSIILGIAFEEKEAEQCKQYINTVGYKLKNKGLLTIPLVGEIFTNLFLKVSRDIKDYSKRKVIIQSLVDFFDETIMTLLSKERFIITKIQSADYVYIPRIKELDYKITDDDAFHLSSAISQKCQRFVTLDRVLLQEHFKESLRKEFGLLIAEP